MKRKLFIIIPLILINSLVYGGKDISGIFPNKNYRPIELDQFPQNWCVAQDTIGIIYIGNTAGLNYFDGVNWGKIKFPNYSVRSLHVSSKGKIYAGGRNQFGEVRIDSAGLLSISLYVIVYRACLKI